MPEPKAGPAQAGVPASPSHWSSVGEFIIAHYACGCPVKVRDAEAAKRMSEVNCKNHA